MPISDRHPRPHRGRRPGETANTSAVVRLMFSAQWNPRQAATSPLPPPDRSAFEFARFACEVAMQYPVAKTIHLVLDNLNTHHCKSLTDTFGEEVGGEG